MMSDGVIEEVVDEIVDLMADGDLEEADAKLAAAMQAHGQAPALLILQTELALEEEDYRGCMASADQALPRVEDDTDKAQLLAFKAYAQFYLDDVDDARQTFNDAVRHDPQLINALLGRAMVHEHMGFLNATMLDLNRIVEQDDQEPQPFAIRGSIHLRFGRIEEAERDFAHAIQLDPDDEESRLNLARIYALDRKTSQAIETLEPLVEHGEIPEFVAPGAILRSQLSLTLGTTDAALEDAQVAIELYPDAPWGYLQAAASHIASGARPGDAIELLKTAESKVKNVRDLPDLFALYAAAYDQLGKTDKAQEYREATEGVARLPGFVYGPLNPAQNIPINPSKPIDIRNLLDELFGEADQAPEGYEDVLRNIVGRIPELVKEHPNVGQLQIELPEAPGMIGGKRHLVVNVAAQKQQSA